MELIVAVYMESGVAGGALLSCIRFVNSPFSLFSSRRSFDFMFSCKHQDLLRQTAQMCVLIQPILMEFSFLEDTKLLLLES